MERFVYPLLTLVVVVLLMLGASIFGASGCANLVPVSSTAPTPGPSPEKPVELVQANWIPIYLPPPMYIDPFHWVAEAWMDAIEEETGGRVHFQRHPAGTLIECPGLWEAVKAGIVDFCNVMPLAEPGAFPMESALSLPGLFPNSTVGTMVTWKLFEEGYTADEFKDVKRLWVCSNSPAGVACREKQIKTLEDWKDLTVACLGEPDPMSISALGATPVDIPMMDQFKALQKGAVDATWLEVHGQIAFKLYEAAGYITNCQGCIRRQEYVMNLDTYNNLPPDIRDVIDRNSGMLWSLISAKRFEESLRRATIYFNSWAEEHGKPGVYYLPQEEMDRWRKAWEPVYEKYISDLEARGYPAGKMIERARELTQQYVEWGLGGS